MPGLMLAVLASAIAANPNGPQLLNGQELVTADDYPLISLRNEEQGSVTVKVHVDPSGLVTNCTVMESSGHSALDAQTCALFRSRARFEPAHNRKGKPASGDYTQKISWVLQGPSGGGPLPRQAWMTRTTVAITKNARIVDCKLEATGFAKQPPDCEVLMAFAHSRQDADDGHDGVAGFSITETYFYPVDAAKAPHPPKLADASQTAQQISKIVIEPDGRVSACEGIEYTGGASPDQDLCAILEKQRFAPGIAGSGTLVGTVVARAYMRSQSIS